MLDNNMEIKISAIIPFFNVEKELLLQCVNSILRQDLHEFEIIIVDDGSKEKFSACLSDIEIMDDRIKIIHQDNKGLSGARNTGARHARGEYITFVDADDLLVPYFFSEAYRIAKENNASFVIGGELHISSRDLEVFRVTNPQVDVLDSYHYKPSVIMITEKLPEDGYIGRGAVARLIKKDILSKAPFQEDVRIGEDIIWNLDALNQCETIYRVHQIWYIYWINITSMTRGYDANMINLCEKHLKEILCRIDLTQKEEAVAYCEHVYEILSSLVCRCFLGRKESSLSVFQRNRIFCKLFKREPWISAQKSPFIKNCSRKIKVKHFLVNIRMLYWAMFCRNLLKREKN